MRLIFIFTTLLILGTAFITSARVKQTGSDETEMLKKLESELADAIVRRDIRLVGNIYADGSIRTHTYTGDLSKEQYLTRLKSNTDRIDSVKVSVGAVRFYAGTAIVTGQIMVEGRVGESDYLRYKHLDRFTHTFVSQQGRWRLVAAHESVVVELRIRTDISKSLNQPRIKRIFRQLMLQRVGYLEC